MRLSIGATAGLCLSEALLLTACARGGEIPQQQASDDPAANANKVACSITGQNGEPVAVDKLPQGLYPSLVNSQNSIGDTKAIHVFIDGQYVGVEKGFMAGEVDSARFTLGDFVLQLVASCRNGHFEQIPQNQKTGFLAQYSSFEP